jgi:ADP-heptose:LPS heptosyltransferase
MDLNFARYVDKWVGLAISLVLFLFERVLAPFTGRRIPPLLATTPPETDTLPAPRRVLCIKFYGLGNAIMLLPVLDALRQRHPGVEIDFLTLTGNVELLQRSGLVTQLHAVDVRSVPRFLRSLRTSLVAIRRRRYDTVLDFEQFVKISTIIAFLSGAPTRIGFNTDGQRRGFMYTVRVVYTDSDHMSAIFARLLRPLGVTGELPATGYPVQASERQIVNEFLAAAGVARTHFPIVAIHLGMGTNFDRVALKRWDAANFAAVADALMERYGAAIVLTGQGAEERALIARTQRLLRRPAIDACDRFSVSELAALVERCHFVVANDTSVMHLAALVGTPVVAFFGPTAPLHYGPRGTRNLVFYRDLYCSPCLTNYNLKMSRCRNPVCMREIRPESVLEAIEAEYLGTTATHRDWLRGRPPLDASAA